MAIEPMRQKTLKSAIGCTGTGLHSGRQVSMSLHPAEPNSGIVLRRTDIAGASAVIPATWDNVVDTRMCTTVGNDTGVRIATIEHLMAALAGCEIDNALIEVNGPEVPIMDGSSAPFIFLVECAGILEQDAPRRAIRILKPLSIADTERSASLTPAARTSFGFEIDFDDAAVAQQTYLFNARDGAFKAELCRARTFGFEHEIVQLRAAGLARGGSLENAVVVSGDKILNEEGLRYDDEFVRHKVLDCIGDLYLAGAPILGHVQCLRSGHTLNNRLLHTLFANPDAWEYCDYPAVIASLDDGERRGVEGVAATLAPSRATAAPA